MVVYCEEELQGGMVRHVLANSLDDSGRLMAKGHWLSDKDVTIAVVLVVVQV